MSEPEKKQRPQGIYAQPQTPTQQQMAPWQHILAAAAGGVSQGLGGPNPYAQAQAQQQAQMQAAALQAKAQHDAAVAQFKAAQSQAAAQAHPVAMPPGPPVPGAGYPGAMPQGLPPAPYAPPSGAAGGLNAPPSPQALAQMRQMVAGAAPAMQGAPNPAATYAMSDERLKHNVDRHNIDHEIARLLSSFDAPPAASAADSLARRALRRGR